MNLTKYNFMILLFVSCAGVSSKNIIANRGPNYFECIDGDVDACFKYAKSQPQGRDRKTTRAAIVTYQYACFQEHPESCLEIGRIYGASTLVISNSRQGEIYRKACDHGELEACVLLADKLAFADAIVSYENVCKQNYGPACSRLAQIYRKNWRFSDGLQKALKFDKKACELGNDVGCISAGQAYFFGSGVEKDSEIARGYFERSCNEKSGAGCAALGKIYAKGIGVEKDPNKATVYANLAEKHRRVNVAQTPQSAYLIFVDACNYGDSLGCFNAGSFLSQGLEITRNAKTAREFFQRACRAGLSSACERRNRAPVAGPTQTTEITTKEVDHFDEWGNKIEK